MDNNTTNDDLDIDDVEVDNIKPEDDEYYTADLSRGDDTSIDDLPEFDNAVNNPLEEDSENEIIYNQDKSRSSNAGGTIRQKRIITEDSVGGDVPGKPGHGGIDEDTG